MVTVRVSNSLEVRPADRLPDAVKEQIRARLTFINPQWEENDKRGYSNWQTPRVRVGDQNACRPPRPTSITPTGAERKCHD